MTHYRDRKICAEEKAFLAREEKAFLARYVHFILLAVVCARIFTPLTVFAMQMTTVNYERENRGTKYIPRAGEPDLMARLQKVFARAPATVNQIMHSSDPNISKWWEGVKKAPDGDVMERLKYINSLTNRTIPYHLDYKLYGKGDYWAIPLETLKNGGDCEDIAILKGMALYRTGWPLERLHILVGFVDYRGKRTGHVVLLADTGTENIVLDNLTDRLVSFEDKQIDAMYMMGKDGATVFVPLNR